MRTRVFGLRDEYTVVGPGALGAPGASVLLRNGGRLDVAGASHPAYLTPDCGSVPDLIVYDKAGERLLEGLLTDAVRRLRDEGVAGDVRALKTTAGPAHISSGCQEDYLIDRGGEFGRLAGILIPFLVTRQLVCGAGAVAQTARGAVYCLSRQHQRTGSGLSRGAARSVPLISTRDEPRTAAAGLRRLRVTVGDSAMSETTMMLKAGATDLVLRMAEAGAAAPDLALGDPVLAIGEVSRDITGQATARLADGRTISALDIQREYLTKARDFTDAQGADPVSARVLGLWERALDAIGTGNLASIAREIDWAIKFALIERYRAEHDLPLSAPQVAQADLAYHDIDRASGLYYQLQHAGAVDRTARDIAIFEAKTAAPAPGRYRRAG